MTLQQKLSSFLVLEGSWIVWLLLGFTIGGAPLFFQRAFHLVGSTWRHRDKPRRRRRDVAPARGVEVTQPGFAVC